MQPVPTLAEHRKTHKARAKLTSMEYLFVDAYDGNALYAMKLAGFNGTDHSLRLRGEAMLRDPDIIEAIRERSKYMQRSQALIADREERQAMWTSIMRNDDPHHKQENDQHGIPKPVENIPLATRLKASEMLGKSEGDFIERVELNTTLTISDLVMGSYDDNTPIEELEAAYYAKKNAIPASSTKIEDEPETQNLEDLI